MPTINHKTSSATKRKMRVRNHMVGTAERPRLSIYRSNRYTSIQAINDQLGVTVAAGSDYKATKGTKTERAQEVATNVAELLKKTGIKAVILDRGPYRYHGRIRAIADAVRAAGVEV